MRRRLSLAYALVDRYRLLVMLLSVLLLAICGVFYTNHIRRESEHKWCDITIVLTDAWRTNPPTTPAGQQLANGFEQLRREFRC